MKQIYSRLFATVLVLVVFSFKTFSATITSNAVTGNWNAPATWVGGVVPGAADDVIIANGATVNITSTPITCLSLTVGQGTSGILVFNTANNNFTVTGTTTVAAGAQLNFTTTTTGTRQFASVIVNGTWNNSANSTATLTGSLTVNTGATFTAGTAVQTFSGAAQTIGGTIASITIASATDRKSTRLNSSH